MSRIIEDKLEPLDGYLAKIIRDTVNGWYTLEVGLPKDWVYKQTNAIACDEVVKSKDGVLLKIYPKNNDIIIDDLIEFVRLIISTNEKIAQKEEEFKESINSIKKDLEERAKKFYEELDKMKEISFNEFDEKVSQNEIRDNVEDKTKESTSIPKKRGRKPKKVKLPDSDE